MSTELIKNEIMERGITRLCHMTQTNKLLHILKTPEGIIASRFVKPDILHSNDPMRLDGYTDYVNCSIEYPNYWYYRQMKDKDPVFKDWAVILIDTDIIREDNSKFCIVNAATKRGTLVRSGCDEFIKLFSPMIIGREKRTRSLNKLDNATTDDQAEVLIYKNIPREFIKGIVFQNNETAESIVSACELVGIPMGYEIYISSDLFSRRVSDKINSGQKPELMRFRED